MLAGVGYFVRGRVMLKRTKLFNNKPADINSTIVNAVSRITSMPRRFRTPRSVGADDFKKPPGITRTA
jgi:hypothetical protein